MKLPVHRRMNTDWRSVRSDRLTPALFSVLTIAAAAIFAASYVVRLRRDGFEAMLAQLHDGALYNRVVIRVDYFHDGFVHGV
jgi:hypothetical protein